MEPTYQQSPSSGFYGLIQNHEQLSIWAYCPKCFVRTKQVFETEDQTREYYRCQQCGELNSYAVR